MSFFTDVDKLKFVERNINRLQAIEEKEAKKVLKSYISARSRIKESLMRTTEGSFSEAQLRISLAEVNATIDQIDRQVLNNSSQGIFIVTEQSIIDLDREVSILSREFEGIGRSIPIDAVLTSLDSKNILFNRYAASLKSYSNETRSIIERELTQFTLSSEPNSRMVNRIIDEIGLIDWKVLRIARTELHNIYNFSKLGGFEEVKKTIIPDLKKSLFHPMDARTGDDSKLAALLELIVDIDKPFKYNFNGKERVFMAPPDRPNDRSIIVPFRDDWIG